MQALRLWYGSPTNSLRPECEALEMFDPRAAMEPHDHRVF
jgi:hypothetical protein